jgi:hypothetical protein
MFRGKQWGEQGESKRCVRLEQKSMQALTFQIEII